MTTTTTRMMMMGIQQSPPTISAAASSSSEYSSPKSTNSTNTTTTMKLHGKKPLPLKQRTSSIDQRRDYTTQTWISVLNLVKLREYVITVDHFPIWRRHLAWAIDDGKDLRDYITQRYAASMVFMSLLLSTELGVLFNSAGVTTVIRQSLRQQAHHTISFWAGIAILISAIFTLLSLISTFTAWTMVSAISNANAHCILRSSIGQYAAELPGRFIVGSIYSFLIWFCLFVFLLLPVGFYSYLLVLIVICLFVHTITAFSAFGRIIMHTGAMGSTPIFDKGYEASLQPHSLHANLLSKAKANLGNKTSIIRQYQTKSKPIARLYSEDEMSGNLSFHSTSDCGRGAHEAFSVPPPPPPPVSTATDPARERTGSLVKFADGYDTNGDRYFADHVVGDASTPTIYDKKEFGGSAQKSNVRNSSIDQTLPFTAPRPPRQHRSEHHDEEVTPLITNQSSTQIIDRWIGSASLTGGDTTKIPNKESTMLTKDKHGHTRRISFDNPYLSFADPTPFVPAIQQDEQNSVTHLTHPFHRSTTTTKTSNSPRYRNDATAKNQTDRLQYDMSSDDEALFNNDYGATDDDDDNNDDALFRSNLHRNNDDDYYFERTSSTTAVNQQQQHPLLTRPSSYRSRTNHRNNKNTTAPNLTTASSEHTRLIDEHRLERGDYNSTR